MNFGPLSKNAVSYSSPSRTNGEPVPSRYEFAKFLGSPPMRNPGASPAWSRTQASIEVVVVFPCVPATTIECRPGRNRSSIARGIEVCWRRRSSTSSASGFPRRTAFPTTIRSGAGSRCFASYPSYTTTPISARIVEVGGYNLRSEPVTRAPASWKSPASAAMPVPPIPIR
jgi:hypothetical protein